MEEMGEEMRDASRAKGIGVDERSSSISSVLDGSRKVRLTQAESGDGGDGGGGGGGGKNS